LVDQEPEEDLAVVEAAVVLAKLQLEAEAVVEDQVVEAEGP
jgi:hypothetical protein